MLAKGHTEYTARACVQAEDLVPPEGMPTLPAGVVAVQWERCEELDADQRGKVGGARLP